MNKIKDLFHFLWSYRSLWTNTIVLVLILCYLLFVFSLPSKNILPYFLLMACTYLFLNLIYKYFQHYRIKKQLQNNIKNNNYQTFQFPISLQENYLLKDYLNTIKHLQRDLFSLKEEKKIQERELMIFNTIWTHQMKVPLAVLDLMSQTDEINPQNLQEEVAKINHYLNLMLQFNRLHASSTDYRFEKIDLKNVINKVIKEYRHFFIKKNLSVQIDDLAITVISDQKWLEFVFAQIIFNAIKYTKTGSLKIYALKKQLIIEDSGIGIEAKDLQRVFELSFTGKNGRIDQKASGLGLYLVKNALDHLGHQITITSQVNVGTKVAIDFSQKNIGMK